jgi:putative transposase
MRKVLVPVPAVAINLQRLATGAFGAHTALPMASLTATPSTAASLEAAGGGKVTPARFEHSQQDGPGLEENGAHTGAPCR